MDKMTLPAGSWHRKTIYMFAKFARLKIKRISFVFGYHLHLSMQKNSLLNYNSY